MRPSRQWARRGIVVPVAVGCLTALVVGTVVYARGGAHVSGGTGGLYSGPVAVGEEFHTFAELETGGASIELVSARPHRVDDGLRADVRLVQRNDLAPIGSYVGPLPGGYRVMPMPGSKIHGRPPDDVPYWLDLRLVADAPGVYRVDGIDVTYRDGFLRERTAQLQAAVCVVASSPRGATSAGCTSPP